MPYLVGFYFITVICHAEQLNRDTRWLLAGTGFTVWVLLQIWRMAYRYRFEYRTPVKDLLDLLETIDAICVVFLAASLYVIVPVMFFVLYYWIKNRMQRNTEINDS
jgi:hypothetical protein